MKGKKKKQKTSRKYSTRTIVYQKPKVEENRKVYNRQKEKRIESEAA